jgi:hypothetical protein
MESHALIMLQLAFLLITINGLTTMAPNLTFSKHVPSEACIAKYSAIQASELSNKGARCARLHYYITRRCTLFFNPLLTPKVALLGSCSIHQVSPRYSTAAYVLQSPRSKFLYYISLNPSVNPRIEILPDKCPNTTTLLPSENKLTPLVQEGKARNITLTCNGITDILSTRGYIVRELRGNTCKELAGIAHISAA